MASVQFENVKNHMAYFMFHSRADFFVENFDDWFFGPFKLMDRFGRKNDLTAASRGVAVPNDLWI